MTRVAKANPRLKVKIKVKVKRRAKQNQVTVDHLTVKAAVMTAKEGETITVTVAGVAIGHVA